MPRLFFPLCLAIIMTPILSVAADPDDPEAAYIEKFLEGNPRVESPPTLKEYATPERFDELYLGEAFEKSLENVSNDNGGIAWGLAYQMMALNDMYRVTRETRYLDANRRLIDAILAATDEKRGKELWTGRVVPAWGCDKYAQRGRAVFAVHTGIITAPIFEFLMLAKENEAGREAHSADFDRIAAEATAALAVHDRQWRDGPAEGEGHYIGLDQEDVCENKPLPGNRLAAMGWALWFSWKWQEDTIHRDHAKAIGRYMRNRLSLSPEGAYFWPYWLDEQPVDPAAPFDVTKGEDSSHAGLTLALPAILLDEGEVYTPEDATRFLRTAVTGFARRTDGILFAQITGGTNLAPSYIGFASKWLCLTELPSLSEEAQPLAGQLRQNIVAFYLNHKPTPAPLELAQLLRYGFTK
jgi:hypothetical protein